MRRLSKARARFCSVPSSTDSLLNIPAFNHFTQTVIRSVERGEIMRWPPRMGTRKAL